MILILLAILSTNLVFQGGSFNLTLQEPAEVLLDECMFFEHSLKNVENLSAGKYGVIVGYGCEEGIKVIRIRSSLGEEKITVNVLKSENFSAEVTELQKELIKLKKEKESLSSRVEYLKSLVEIINSINVELYDKIRAYEEENLRLKRELESAKAEIENYSRNLNATTAKMFEIQETLESLKSENSELKSELRGLQNKLESVTFYTETFKFSTISLIAILVGILLAFLRRF